MNVQYETENEKIKQQYDQQKEGIKTLKRRNTDLNQENTEQKKRIEKLDNQNAAHNEEIKKLENQNIEQKERIDKLEASDYGSLLKQSEEISQENLKLRVDYQSLLNQSQALYAQLATMASQRDNAIFQMNQQSVTLNYQQQQI